jgi:hypothetical protein
MKIRPGKRRIRTATLGIAVAALGMALPAQASAQLTACRSDPVVFLSNNHKVQLTSTVNTAASNVTSVNYVLHAPAGSAVTSVTWTGGGIKESLAFYPDAGKNTYTMSSRAQVQQGSVKVSLKGTVVNQASGGQTSGSANATAPSAASVQVTQS